MSGTTTSPGLRSGLMILLVAFIVLAATNFFDLLLMPFYANLGEYMRSDSWWSKGVMGFGWLNGFAKTAATLLVVLGVVRLRRAWGEGVLGTLMIALFSVGFIGALVLTGWIRSLLVDLLRPEDFSREAMDAVYRQISWFGFGTAICSLLGLAALAFSLTSKSRHWLWPFLGALAGLLAVYIWNTTTGPSKDGFPWLRSLLGNGFELAVFILFVLLLRPLLQESDTQTEKPDWSDAAKGVLQYYGALRARIIILLVGVPLGFVFGASRNIAMIAVGSGLLLLVSLITTFLMMLGLSRFTEAPAQSGARGLSASSLLFQCLSLVGDLSVAALTLQPLVRKDSFFNFGQEVLPWGNLLVNASGLIGLVLLLLAFRRAARAVGAPDLAEQGSSLLWLLGITLVGVFSLTLMVLNSELKGLLAALLPAGLVLLIVALVSLLDIWAL